MAGNGDNNSVILATGSYDHTIRFWQAHSGLCTRTVQHSESVSPYKIFSGAVWYDLKKRLFLF